MVRMSHVPYLLPYEYVMEVDEGEVRDEDEKENDLRGSLGVVEQSIGSLSATRRRLVPAE